MSEKLNAVQAALVKGVPLTTFHTLVRRGDGPPFYVQGKARYFLKDEVDAWVLPPIRKHVVSEPRPSPTWQFDEQLIDCHARGMTDVECTRVMLDQGLPVTSSDVATARRRLGLTANRRHAVKFDQGNPPPPKARVDPMAFAKRWLGDRMATRSSGFWLDGTPVNLDPLMREANRVAVRHGAEPVVSCERWVP